MLPDAARLPRQLFIVQRNEVVARSLARCLAPFVAEVHVVACPARAEQLMLAPGELPIDVICGVELGPDVPPGTSWVARFRALPRVDRVVLATGSSAAVGACDADLVVHKPVDPGVLLSFLQSNEARQGAA